MNFLCACCGKKTNGKEAIYRYLGMGSSQYICLECQKLPYAEVIKKANEEHAPTYIGSRRIEDVIP